MNDVLGTPEATPPRDDRVRWPRAVRGPLIAASVVVIIAGLRAGAGVFAPIVLAAFIAVVSLPLLRWLMRKGVPVPIAIPLVVLLDAAVLAVVGLILVQSVAELRAVAPAYLARIQELELEAILRLQGWGYEVTVLPYREIVNPERMFALATGAALRLTEIAGITLLVVLYLVFMLAESVGLPTKLRRAFGDRFGNVARMSTVVGEVQRYLALKTVVSLATGVLIGTAAAVIGVDFALFWGFLAFVLNYVPSVGSFLAAVPALAVSMLQLGAGRSGWDPGRCRWKC
jgi:AI-2 transport protein TqsA